MLHLASQHRVLGWWRSPAARADALLIVKAVVAAVCAWLVATRVLDSDLPFLAPWSALLTVHGSVYRSLWHGMESLVATLAGVLVAYVTAAALGFGVGALSVALLVGMALSRLRLLRREGVAVATTALFVLTTGAAGQQVALAERVGDVALGVAVGVLVNALVVAPLDVGSARDRAGRVVGALVRLVEQLAEELEDSRSPERAREWIGHTRSMDDDLAGAWPVVRHAQESAWWNPRPSSRGGRREADDLAVVLRLLEDAVAQLRALARTVDGSTASAQRWDDRFRAEWLLALRECGRLLGGDDAPDPRGRVDRMVADLSHDGLSGLLWPTYGALISGLRNLIAVADDLNERRSAGLQLAPVTDAATDPAMDPATGSATAAGGASTSGRE